MTLANTKLNNISVGHAKIQDYHLKYFDVLLSMSQCRYFPLKEIFVFIHMNQIVK